MNDVHTLWTLVILVIVLVILTILVSNRLKFKQEILDVYDKTKHRQKILIEYIDLHKRLEVRRIFEEHNSAILKVKNKDELLIYKHFSTLDIRVHSYMTSDQMYRFLVDYQKYLTSRT